MSFPIAIDMSDPVAAQEFGDHIIDIMTTKVSDQDRIMTTDDFKGQSLYSVDQLSKKAINYLVDQAIALRRAEIAAMKEGNNLRDVVPQILSRKVMISAFMEPSTRTRVSSEMAMHNLGGRVITVEGRENNSLIKGETLDHMLEMLAGYRPNLIVMRTNVDDAIKTAAYKHEQISWVNGGDGKNEHPTQTLTDLATIKEKFGRLNNLKIVLGGDLKHGRTTRSLIKALSKFENQIYLMAPDSLQMDSELVSSLHPSSKVSFIGMNRIDEVMHHVDVAYFTRPQMERMSEDDKAKYHDGVYQVTPEMVEGSNVYIMHPLPIDTTKSGKPEIATEVERKFPHQIGYFNQAAFGALARMSAFANLLGKGQDLQDFLEG